MFLVLFVVIVTPKMMFFYGWDAMFLYREYLIFIISSVFRRSLFEVYVFHGFTSRCSCHCDVDAVIDVFLQVRRLGCQRFQFILVLVVVGRL